jgi:hypothetical protein
MAGLFSNLTSTSYVSFIAVTGINVYAITVAVADILIIIALSTTGY